MAPTYMTCAVAAAAAGGVAPTGDMKSKAAGTSEAGAISRGPIGPVGESVEPTLAVP